MWQKEGQGDEIFLRLYIFFTDDFREMDNGKFDIS